MESSNALPERIEYGTDQGNPGIQRFLAEHREEYFFCERERCIMRKTACLQYQKQSKKRIIGQYGRYFFNNKATIACERANCWGCEQGKRIKEEISLSDGKT